MATESQLLFTEFPLYCVCPYKDDVFMIAGGGGKSKTGIQNALELYRLSKNGVYVADNVCHHDMGIDLMMQCSVNSDFLAASINDECRIYTIESKEGQSVESTIVESIGSIQEESRSSNEDNGHNDGSDDGDDDGDDGDGDDGDIGTTDGDKKGSPDDSIKGTTSEDHDEFKITEIAAAISDKILKDPFQNVVKFYNDHVITAGEEGSLRLWKLPELEMIKTMKGHSKEVNDLAVHPTKKICVSVSRDETAKVWDLEELEEIHSFQWSDGHRFRACCFSDFNNQCHFMAINIPTSNKTSEYCYLTKWDCENWKELNTVKVTKQILTTITSYKNYIGIGDATGGVAIYTTDLNLILRKSQVHLSCVTDVCFHTVSTRDKPDGLLVLLSVSVDQRCCLTEVKNKGYSWSILIVFLTILIIITAVVLPKLI